MNDDPRLTTPCVKVCTVSADGSHCIGCYRTLDEIARWGSMDEAERRQVLAACDARMEALFDDG